MRKNRILFRLLVTVFVLFPLLPVSAQIGLRIEVSQLHFLQYEPVYVKVTMRNFSGHPLAFGENAGLRGTLRFEINMPGSGRYIMPKGKETPPLKGAILQSGATRVFTCNICRFYDLRRLGNYSVKAVISHPQLKSAYESNTVQFSVVKGNNIWQSVVGVPQYLLGKDKKTIPTRLYRVISYNTGDHFIYVLRIEDKEKVYLVRRLGLDLGKDLKPQCAVDDLSRLNLLIAASPKVFAFYQYDVSGKLEKKEIRIKSDSTPRLVVNRDVGTVILSGGRRARRDMDYEEIKDLPFMSYALEEQTRDITAGKSILDEKDDD